MLRRLFFAAKCSLPWLLSLLFFLPAAFAADAPASAGSPSSSVSPKTLQAKIKEVETSTSLDEEARAKLLELYRLALSYEEAARSNAAAAQAFAQARKAAPAEAKKIRRALEKARKASPKVKVKVSRRTPIAEIEQQLLKEKANLAAVEAKLADIQQQLAHEAERSTPAGKRLSEVKKRQEKIAEELAAPPLAEEPPQFSEARRWLLQAQADALRSEVRMLDEELLSQPMRVELLEARRDQALYDRERINQRVRLLTDLLNERQRSQTEQAVEKAEEAKHEALGKHPLVQQLAEKNASLSTELTTLVSELERVSDAAEVAKSEARRIGEEFRGARQKLEIAGISQAIGQVLLEQRRALPDVRQFRKETRKRERLIADASLRQIQYEEELRALRNRDEYIRRLTRELPADEAKAVRKDLQVLVDSRLALIKRAIALNKSYLRALAEFDLARRELSDTVEAYDAFLAERLLWIRSSPPLSLELIEQIPAQLGQLLAPGNWLEAGGILLRQLLRSPLYVLLLLISLGLIARLRALRRLLKATGRLANDPLRGRIVDTLKALLLTLLIAASWPLLITTLGWQLGALLDASAFSKSFSEGLLWVAPIFFFLRVFRVLMLPGGVATMHFNWPDFGLRRLRRALLRLMIFFLPTGFVVVFAANYDALTLGGGLGRLALILGLMMLAAFFYRLFGLRDSAWDELQKWNRSSLLMRLRYLWLVLGVGLPLSLAVIAALGYVYTALTLTGSLLDTLWFSLILLVVHQLAVHWLLMAQRRLRYQALREQRAARLAAQDADEAAKDDLPSVAEEPEVDLVALDQQSRKLLNTALFIAGLIGLWVIWSDVLPAFGILDKVTLWHYMGIVDGAEKLIPVTLADAGIAILIAVVTIIATRSLPALMELVLLQRLSMQTGSRYAATTLTRYTIAAVGTLLAVSAVGASWSQVQWLAAALSVGIGFGLQEIVANFISGLIILFERPIRVGDYVTVGDSSGTVSRIRIRATTILTRDRKELLVPNKEFITGRLLNWSLSDQVTRIVLPVGVAYGSDVDQAMSIMEKVALGNEQVLETPEPFVTFESFGDSSLLLNLRCFVGSIEHRLLVISELHEEINRRFAEVDINIAFPQMDVHLDTSAPLDIRVHQGGTPPPTA